MGKQMNPLGNNDNEMIMDIDASTSAYFQINNLSKIMHQNRIFSQPEVDWYQTFNRYGWIDPFTTDQICKEYLFFTKPDLFIFDTKNYALAGPGTLSKSLSQIPFFRDAAERHKAALAQLQYTLNGPDGKQNPFMCLLTNAVTGKMDLPGITAEMQQATSNIYGVSLDYRSHSIKSDYAFDFSLSFADTAYLEIYTMVKAYDEYMRMMKMGEIKLNSDYNDSKSSIYNTYKQYIIDRIIPEQFSVYKFLVGSDGETILYYAKATGVYFTDVPRSDFGDPGNDGFKFSLTFHANFIEDNNPLILTEFNAISPAASRSYIDVYDSDGINNEWAKYPKIVYATASDGDKRVARRSVSKDYRLKWTNARNTAKTGNSANLTIPNITNTLTPKADANLYSHTDKKINDNSNGVYDAGSLRISTTNNDRSTAKAIYVTK